LTGLVGLSGTELSHSATTESLISTDTIDTITEMATYVTQCAAVTTH